ncbi:MAG TPA: phage tail family protein [Bacillota bacterium]|nr:phage tail family protein [Bacillota bacterium]
MVKFNEIDITDIAPVEILNIIVEKPEVIITAKERPVKSGVSFVRRKYGPRYVRVSFTLPVENAIDRANYFTALDDWLNETEPKTLRLQNHDGCYLMATFFEMSEPSERDWAEELELVFECQDPAYTSDTEYAVACGSAFGILNKETPLWRIEATYGSSQSSPDWVLDGTYTLALSGTVGAGELIINSEDQTIELDGTSIIDQMTIASRFFKDSRGNSAMTKGAHTIVGDGTLYWRERWI